MQIKVIYSQTQLDRAVEFVAKNNRFFIDKNDKIRSAILNCIEDLIRSQNTDEPMYYFTTMGFAVSIDEMILESMYDDENKAYISILVDPDLAGDRMRAEINIQTMEV